MRLAGLRCSSLANCGCRVGCRGRHSKVYARMKEMLRSIGWLLRELRAPFFLVAAVVRAGFLPSSKQFSSIEEKSWRDGTGRPTTTTIRKENRLVRRGATRRSASPLSPLAVPCSGRTRSSIFRCCFHERSRVRATDRSVRSDPVVEEDTRIPWPSWMFSSPLSIVRAREARGGSANARLD